jgi:hypothetical protein
MAGSRLLGQSAEALRGRHNGKRVLSVRTCAKGAHARSAGGRASAGTNAKGAHARTDFNRGH